VPDSKARQRCLARRYSGHDALPADCKVPWQLIAAVLRIRTSDPPPLRGTRPSSHSTAIRVVSKTPLLSANRDVTRAPRISSKTRAIGLQLKGGLKLWSEVAGRNSYTGKRGSERDWAAHLIQPRTGSIRNCSSMPRRIQPPVIVTLGTTAVAMGIVAMDGRGAVISALGDSNAWL
jgi:hypothetical protein